MSGFTPGPWRADPDLRPGMEWNIHIYCGADDRVCFMSNGQNSEANARLISAAPELYEALVGICSTFPDDAPALIEARAALAKARGETL